MLGYPEQMFANEYYTAHPCAFYGVCVAYMVGSYFIQFFPWGGVEPPRTAHQRYADFVLRQASTLDDKYRGLPYYKLPLGSDLLTIKCLIEEGIKECHA